MRLEDSKVAKDRTEDQDASKDACADGNNAADVAMLDAVRRNDAVGRTQPEPVTVERGESGADEGRAADEGRNLLGSQPPTAAEPATPGNHDEADKNPDDKADEELKRPCEPIGASFHWVNSWGTGFWFVPNHIVVQRPQYWVLNAPGVRRSRES